MSKSNMKTLVQKESLWSYSYDDLVSSFEYEILLEKHDDDYQGDSVYLLKNKEKYGYLVISWGSCSGCDALQGCDSYEEIVELRDDIHNNIHWEDSSGSMIQWLKKRDWETQSIYYSGVHTSALSKSIQILKGL